MTLNSLAGALALLVPALACAGPISSFSVYGVNSVNLGSDVVVKSGFVGSGGNVGAGAASELKSNVYAGGSISAGDGAAVDGSAIATGTVNIGAAAKVGGSIDAGATSGVAVSVGNAAVVSGAITHRPGTTVSTGGGAAIGAEAVGVPALFVAPSLPVATAFSSGGISYAKGNGEILALAPGSYGAVSLGSADVFKLSAGYYFFDSLSVGNASTFQFDLAGGPIALFFSGDVHLGEAIAVILSGGDASGVYAETAGNWIQDAGGDWFGTVYGSGATSDLSFGAASNLTGAFYSAHDLGIGRASVVNLLASARPIGATAIPEPSSIALGVIGVGVLAVVRRRRDGRLC